MTDFKDMNFKIARSCDRGFCHRGCGRQDKQLNAYDWLADVPGNDESTDLVEVQFKNTRKGYYHNVNNLDLKKGDIVAVEASPGHDIGVVTMTGRLVKLQIKKANLKSADDIKRVYRIAKPVDMDKYREAKSREHGTMIQSRQIAKELGLQMKIGDVEYQGDGNKAIFYYIADERVDFRQLIKVLADTFHVRIEMKQIGARQEAGRIGGTGPCGRELCCATWMKNFVSVSTNAARYQDISLNPQKLAGLCAKLKCCLNYEVDDYVEASRKLPSKEVSLFTQDSEYFLFKTDILAGLVTYSTQKGAAVNLETITAERAKEIIELNKHGEKPESLSANGEVKETNKHTDLLADADISRFDKSKKKRKAKNKNRNKEAAATQTDNNAATAQSDSNNAATAQSDNNNAATAQADNTQAARQTSDGKAQQQKQARGNRRNNQQRGKNQNRQGKNNNAAKQQDGNNAKAAAQQGNSAAQAPTAGTQAPSAQASATQAPATQNVAQQNATSQKPQGQQKPQNQQKPQGQQGNE